MAKQVLIEGQVAWLKSYPAKGPVRELLTRSLNGVVGWLGVEALRSPPRRAGEGAKQIEWRRLQQLHTHGIRVPQILGTGKSYLILSDQGPTLSTELKDAMHDDEQQDALVAATISAIDAVHQCGEYLGQAFPRNITIEHAQVGFIDFEEDPREVMPLSYAQSRDWLLFATGVARYYRERERRLAELLRQHRSRAGEVEQLVGKVVENLHLLERGSVLIGHRRSFLAVALRALRQSFN